MDLNGLVGTEIEIKKHAEGYRIKKTKYLVLQAYKHYVLCEKITDTGAEIKFIRLKSGKWNPVDIAKRTFIKDEGNETLITDDGEVCKGRFASLEDGANAAGYISHFATCPNANAHRRGQV